MCIVKAIPRFSWRHVSSPSEPMVARETDNGEQCIANLVHNQDWGVCDGCIDGCLVEHHHLRELCEEELLGTSLLGTLFAGPIGNGRRTNRFSNRISSRHLLGGRRDGELRQGIWPNILVVTMITLDLVCDLESHQLVEKGNLVAEKLNQLM